MDIFHKVALVVLLLSSLGDIMTSQEGVGFRARPQDITATVGSSVRFRCKVTELSINQAVAWLKSDRAGLATEWLTSGNDVIAPKPLAGRIKIVGTSRSNLRYDLVIKKVNHVDDGLYICNVLTFGNAGIKTRRKSKGNILRIIPQQSDEDGSATTAIAAGSESPDPRQPPTSTLYCNGVDENRRLLVGEIITLRCIKWIHRYANRDDVLTLKWTKNNRTIASERFEPHLPQVGRRVSLFGENLTVEFTFRVETFDSNATFTCESEDRDDFQPNDVCTLGPLRVTLTSEFIISGRSVAYVEEGDGLRLFCPKPFSENVETRNKHIVWSQGPLLGRDRYTVQSDTMHVYRLSRADDGLRVSCLLHSSRRTVLLGETLVRVTINGEKVMPDDTQLEMLETTVAPLTVNSQSPFSSSNSNNDQLYGSGAEFGEFPDGSTESTWKYVTSEMPKVSLAAEMHTTFKTTPSLLTIRGETEMPGDIPRDEADSNLIDTFHNFNFPSEKSDWPKDGDGGLINIHIMPTVSPEDNGSNGFLYTVSHLDETTVYILIFITPATVLIFVLLCVTLLICGPTNRFNRSWSNYGKPREKKQPPQTFIESVWATKSRGGGRLERPTEKTPSPFQLMTDTDPTEGYLPVAGTHIYESTSHEWITGSVSTSHFERHTKLKTFGESVDRYDHLQRMEDDFDVNRDERYLGYQQYS